jgi:radical SAM protein with 4Fe4S-binding SPASM domain
MLVGEGISMLPVSDLLDVARDGLSEAELRAGAPRRFGEASKVPAVVVWNICMHCNMTCPHCYAAAVSEPSPTDLSHEEALALLDDLAASGLRVLIFSGGEPLLRPDLFELLARARQLGISAQLSTNGVLIDRSVAARLAALDVGYVGVSIDGLRPFNDGYRGLAGGYDAALRGLRLAREAGMRTGLRMTLTQRNADQLEEMVGVAGSVGAERIYISHLLYSGRGFQVAEHDLARAEARAVLWKLFALAEALLLRGEGPRIVTGGNDSGGVLLLRWIGHRYGEAAAEPVRRLLLERGGNSAGERILNIDSRGRVHPDQFWRSAVLGDVRQQKFAEILEHPLREQLRRRLDHITGRCAQCDQRSLCRGSHRERALARHRDPWASDPSCVMEDGEIGVAGDAALPAAREIA